MEYLLWKAGETMKKHSLCAGSARQYTKARFIRQGADAPMGALCPYRAGSAAATWWAIGRLQTLSQEMHDIASALHGMEVGAYLTACADNLQQMTAGDVEEAHP